MGKFKDRERKPHNGPQHAKPNVPVTKPLSKEEQLKADVEMIDNAYRKAALKKQVEPKSKSPMLDAYEDKTFGKGNGKHRK